MPPRWPTRSPSCRPCGQAGDPTMRVDTRADAPRRPSRRGRSSRIFAGHHRRAGARHRRRVRRPRSTRACAARSSCARSTACRSWRGSPRRTAAHARSASAVRSARARQLRALPPGELSAATEPARDAQRAAAAAPRRGTPFDDDHRRRRPPRARRPPRSTSPPRFALAGKRVILIEADLRRPKIGGALRVRATRGIASVLIDGLPLERGAADDRGLRREPEAAAGRPRRRVDGGPVLAARRHRPRRRGEGDGRHRDHRLAAADRGDRRAAARADRRRRAGRRAPRPHPHQQAHAPRRAARPVRHQARRASRSSASARRRSTATTPSAAVRMPEEPRRVNSR